MSAPTTACRARAAAMRRVLASLAARLDLDGTRLPFLYRSAGASLLAFVLAWALGLAHPQWAAMSVWIASQPTRGLLLEKGFFRVAGTLLGAAFGVALVLVCDDRTWLLVLGLTLWLGLCVWLGNVLRALVSYGALVASYTAVMVAMLNPGPAGQVLAMGADRCATVLTGVLTALLVGWLFNPREPASSGLQARLDALDAELLRALAGWSEGRVPAAAQTPAALLAQMAALELTLDPHGAGLRPRRRREAGLARLRLGRRAGLLAALQGLPAGAGRPGFAAALDAAAAAPAAPALRAAIVVAPPALQAPLQELLADQQPGGPAGQQRPGATLHRDWQGAREAALRAMLLMALVGAFWLLTRAHVGPLLLLGSAVMIALFSTFEHPARIIRFVLLGQALGAVAALACRWLLWPLAGSTLQQILLTLPILLSAPLLLAQRRLAPAGMDYVLIALLLLQPQLPLPPDLPASVLAALGVVLGPALAWVAYRLVFHTHAGRRRDALVTLMVRELQAQAARPVAAPAARARWRLRLQQRLLQLAHWAGRAPTAAEGASILQGGCSALQLRDAIELLQARLAAPPAAGGEARALRHALSCLRHLARRPARAARALARAARRLSSSAPGEAARLEQAGAALRLHADFFRRAATRSA